MVTVAVVVTAPSATVWVVVFTGGVGSVVPELWGETLVTYSVAFVPWYGVRSWSIVVPVTVGVVEAMMMLAGGVNGTVHPALRVGSVASVS